MTTDNEKLASARVAAEPRAIYDAVIRWVTESFRAHVLPSDSDYEQSPDYREAMQKIKQFEPKDGCEYDWTYDYAVNLYRSLERTFEAHDQKADAVIKYLGGGSALVTLGAIGASAMNPSSKWLLLLFLPSLVFAIHAIYLASHVRKPKRVTKPPPIPKAIEYAEAYRGKAKATLIAVWNAATVGLAHVNEAKAKDLLRAQTRYFLAVLFLLLPLLGAVVLS